jgi:hypothetical protein
MNRLKVNQNAICNYLKNLDKNEDLVLYDSN